MTIPGVQFSFSSLSSWSLLFPYPYIRWRPAEGIEEGDGLGYFCPILSWIYSVETAVSCRGQVDHHGVSPCHERLPGPLFAEKGLYCRGDKGISIMGYQSCEGDDLEYGIEVHRRCGGERGGRMGDEGAKGIHLCIKRACQQYILKEVLFPLVRQTYQGTRCYNIADILDPLQRLNSVFIAEGGMESPIEIRIGCLKPDQDPPCPCIIKLLITSLIPLANAQDKKNAASLSDPAYNLCQPLSSIITVFT